MPQFICLCWTATAYHLKCIGVFCGRNKCDISRLNVCRVSAARSVCDVQSAVERIFPLVYEFRKMRTPEDEELFRQKRAGAGAGAAAGAGAGAAAAGAPVTHSDDEAGDACE